MEGTGLTLTLRGVACTQDGLQGSGHTLVLDTTAVPHRRDTHT